MIQRISLVQTQRLRSLRARRWGWIVLKAEEKSMKRILTKEPGAFKWVYALCKSVSVASSVDLFALYANYSGSSACLVWVCMVLSTNRSKHFITIGVKATGQKSFNSFGVRDFGTGGMIEVFQSDGTTQSLKDHENNMLKMYDNWSTQFLSNFPPIPSGPTALCTFCFLNTEATSLLWISRSSTSINLSLPSKSCITVCNSFCRSERSKRQ